MKNTAWFLLILGLRLSSNPELNWKLLWDLWNRNNHYEQPLGLCSLVTCVLCLWVSLFLSVLSVVRGKLLVFKTINDFTVPYFIPPSHQNSLKEPGEGAVCRAPPLNLFQPDARPHLPSSSPVKVATNTHAAKYSGLFSVFVFLNSSTEFDTTAYFSLKYTSHPASSTSPLVLRQHPVSL